MAIAIPSFCLAIKDNKSCQASLQIAEKLFTYFKSKVTVFLASADKSGIPQGFKVESLPGVKHIGKSFNSVESDMLILPIISSDSNFGLVTAAEANKIIDHIERLVLTVPCRSEVFNLSNIVVPIDSSFETRQKVPYALSMARAFGSKLFVVGVSNDKGKDAEVLIKNYMRQVCNNIEEKGFSFVSEIRLGGNPTEQVLEYAKEVDAGMIVIMTEQETNFTSFFSGKYSQQMVKASNIPVLSIHPKDLIVSDARL
jgi:nucleotide-binding universal stress UspA family protein